MSVWIGMIGGLDKHRGDKGLPCIGHRLAFCSLLVLMILCFYETVFIEKTSILWRHDTSWMDGCDDSGE